VGEYSSASDTTVSSGGTEYVSGAVIVEGGDHAPYSHEVIGAVTVGTTVEAGGSEILSLGGVASDTFVAGGSVTVLSGGAVFGGSIGGGGGILALAGASLGGPIDFSGPGTLALATPQDFSATIGGFAVGDRIDLTGLVFAGATTGTLVGDVLSATEGGVTQTVTLDPTGLAGATFLLSRDSGGGTAVALACFRAGTRIATATGDVPVEHLAVGDLVRTHFAGTAKIVWLGHRRVECRRHPRPREVWPVRLRAGAFGTHAPARDLFLSPDHAVFVDGALIPVRLLVDGEGIVQDACDAVTYWHVELARHDVIQAEGLGCESFLDTGNRAAFADAGAAMQLHAAFAAQLWDAESCAPLIVAGAKLDAARAIVCRRTQGRRESDRARRAFHG